MPMIRVNGIDLHYIDQGKGFPLVLVHNVMSNTEGFEFNLPALTPHYRVIAFDLRGHGKTTHVDAEAEAPAFYTFDNIAEDLYQLLKALRIEHCFLFGQAYWGVSTALTFFHHHPEMVRGIVTAACQIISSDEGGNPFDQLKEETKKGFLRMHELARTKGMSAVFEERKRLKTFWGDRVLNDPEILRRFAGMYEKTSPTAFLHFPPLSHTRHKEIAATLRATRIPLMLLMGSEDSHTDEMIADMRADYPGTHVLLLHKCGHYPTIESPNEFNRAMLDFFAGINAYGGSAAAGVAPAAGANRAG